MDVLKKLSREARIVLGGGVVLLILSFLNWQGGVWNEWHGFVGIVAGLLVIAMLVWEVLRLLGVKIELGSLSPGLMSVALALLVALFTVIAFFNKSLARDWPAWVALIVAIVVAVAAIVRARAEGVQMPAGMPGTTGGSTGPPTGGTPE